MQKYCTVLFTKMNINDVTNRFIEFYTHLSNNGIVKSASQFAEKIALTRSGMNEILKGRSKVGLQTVLNTVHSFPILNTKWLILGSGSMLESLDENEGTPQNHNLDSLKEEIKSLRNEIEDKKKMLGMQEELIAMMKKEISRLEDVDHNRGKPTSA